MGAECSRQVGGGVKTFWQETLYSKTDSKTGLLASCVGHIWLKNSNKIRDTFI